MSDEPEGDETWGLLPPSMDDAVAQRCVALAVLMQYWRVLDAEGRALLSGMADKVTRSIEVKEGAAVRRIRTAD
jgi:hypothetical protein